MKKLIALCILAFATMTFATAQIGLTLGVRGVFSYSAGSSVDDDYVDFWDAVVQETASEEGWGTVSTSVDASGKSGGGFSLFMRLPLGQRIGVQAEFGYTYNVVATEVSVSGDVSGTIDKDISFNVMTVPILFTYNVVQTDRFFVTPFGGIQIAKPIGKTGIEGAEANITTFALFSFVVGASATVNFGKFGLVGDIRYNIGVNSIESAGIKYVTPRALQLSAGLQYML